jgi:peptidoglycan/xylan/chitin deacetylase (PgdA/CDA1 family)
MIVRRCLERLFLIFESVVTASIYPLCLLRERVVGVRRIPILMYHQIGRIPEGAERCGDCLSPDRFVAQVRAIVKAGYSVIPLADALRTGAPGAPRARRRRAVLTFDDGYQDQLANARPVLNRYRLPATFFLVAGSIGRSSPLPHLALKDSEAREGGPARGWKPPSWEAVRDLVVDGMTIGSHGLSHRSLGSMSLQEAEIEIRRSRQVLERRLGGRVDLFAYPFGSMAYGDFDEAVQSILRAAGYRAACTTVVGRNGCDSDPMALRRIPMEERDGPWRVRFKLAGAYDWVGRLKTLWQRLVPREDDVQALWVESTGGGRA